MGQQQLLLIVLGVIIVGIAVVAGIYLYLHRAEESVKDEVYSRNLDIANLAVQYYSKPDDMGGGGRSYEKFLDYYNSNFSHMKETTSATFQVEKVSNDEIKIHGLPKANLGYKWKVVTVVNKIKISSSYIYE